MVLFGSDSLFASHLPLYRAPHDWQVVLEVEPQDQAVAESFRQSDGMLTIEPEPFDLTRLDPQAEDPLPAFAAKVYKGHFERGGELWLENVIFSVKRVPVYRRLLAEAKREIGEYFVVRGASSTHLIHRIGPKPDFDQILKVCGEISNSNLIQLRLPLGGPGLDHRLGTNPQTDQLLSAHGACGATEIYLETSDLGL